MRERVFAVGGSIHVDSSPGQGTLVAITLPLKGAAGS
jgi:two-component system sensor histidine kinase UhpB